MGSPIVIRPAGEQDSSGVAAAVLVLAALLGLSALTPRTAAADPSSPHLSTGTTTDTCAACHRSHTAEDENLVEITSESALCFSCHDGTGADSNIAAEYSDANVPADDPDTGSYYAHRLDVDSTHTSGLVNEFGGVLNRHSACTDCHNPHAANANPAQPAPGGWAPSGASANVTGVTGGLLARQTPELRIRALFKCQPVHGAASPARPQPTRRTKRKNSKRRPARTTHRGAGHQHHNATQNSLLAAASWQLSVASTIRCTQCHGNYRLVGDPRPRRRRHRATGPHTSRAIRVADRELPQP
jgi:predicted CXXCH cytochrome family protein